MPGLDFPGGIFSFSAMGTNFSRIFRSQYFFLQLNKSNCCLGCDFDLEEREDRGSSANLFKWSIRPNLEQEREKPKKLSICDSNPGMGIGSVYFLKHFFILLL